MPQKLNKRDINSTKCLDRLCDPCVLQDACHELLFCVFGDFYALGREDTEIAK